MKVINAGLMLLVVAVGFFVTDTLRMERVGKILFDRELTNVNMDMIVTDAFDSAVAGIDEFGEAVFFEEVAEVHYVELSEKVLGSGTEDGTGFILFTTNEDIDGEALEKEASEQIKAVNKRLDYDFLFTEDVSSFRYNPIETNSIYAMFLPIYSNIIRLENNDIVYTLSGAKLE